MKNDQRNYVGVGVFVIAMVAGLILCDSWRQGKKLCTRGGGAAGTS